MTSSVVKSGLAPAGGNESIAGLKERLGAAVKRPNKTKLPCGAAGDQSGHLKSIRTSCATILAHYFRSLSAIRGSPPRLSAIAALALSLATRIDGSTGAGSVRSLGAQGTISAIPHPFNSWPPRLVAIAGDLGQETAQPVEDLMDPGLVGGGK